MVEIRKIETLDEFVKLKDINDRAFPDSERLSADDIIDCFLKLDADINSVRFNKEMRGFCIVTKNSKSAYVYFLAISEKYRSKGIGAAALKAIERTYADRQIFLDFETTDEEGAQNREIRKRRRAFYLRNGFKVTGVYTRFRNIPFELVTNADDPDYDSLRLLFKAMNGVDESFCPVLFDRFGQAYE